MADAGRPSSMSSHKLRRLAAAGRGEQLVPQLFVTREEGGPIPRHVVTIDDVTKGLGLDAATAERIQRLIAGTNVSFATKGGEQRLIAGRSALVEFLRQQSVDSDIRQEITKRALAYWRRTQVTDLQKEPTMRYVFKSEALEKAAKGDQVSGHKYTRREPDGKGGWRYFYRQPGQAGTREKVVAGAVVPAKPKSHGREQELKPGMKLGGDLELQHISHDGEHTTLHLYDTRAHRKLDYRSKDGENWESRNPEYKFYDDNDKLVDAPFKPVSELWSKQELQPHHSHDSDYQEIKPPKKEASARAQERKDREIAAGLKAVAAAKRTLQRQLRSGEGIDHPKEDAGPGHFYIANREEGAERVEGQRFGNFGVHKTKTGDGHNEHFWTVTHLPTGSSMYRPETKVAAQRYARHMQEHANDLLTDTKLGQTKFSDAQKPHVQKLFEHHKAAVDLASKLGKSEVLPIIDLRKASRGESVSGHKYLRREPDGKGGWHYIYETAKPQKVSHTEGKDKVEWDPHKGEGHIITNGKRHELVKNPHGVSVREQPTGKHSWESSGRAHHVGPSNMTGRQLHEAAKHALSRKADNPRHKVNPNRMSSPHKHERRHDYQD